MGNMSLVKVGRVCAILVAVSFIVAIIIRGVADVPGFKNLTDDAEQWLLAVNANRAAFLSYMWFLLLGSVLLIPAALGFYQALRVAGALLWIAVAAMFTGDHSQALLEERLDPLPILSADLSMCQVLLKPELCPGVIS